MGGVKSRTAAATTMRLLFVMESGGREGRADRRVLRHDVPWHGGGDAGRLSRLSTASDREL